MMFFGMPALDLIESWVDGVWAPSERTTFPGIPKTIGDRLEEVNVNNNCKTNMNIPVAMIRIKQCAQVVEEYSETGDLQPEYRYITLENFSGVEDGLLPSVNSLCR
jgi:hypothetical protein